MLWLGTLDNGHPFTKPICFLCLGFYSKVYCKTLTPTSTFFLRGATPHQQNLSAKSTNSSAIVNHLTSAIQKPSSFRDGQMVFHTFIIQSIVAQETVRRSPVRHMWAMRLLLARTISPPQSHARRDWSWDVVWKNKGKGLDFSIFILHLKVWLFDIFWLVRYPSQTTTMVGLV